MTDMNADTDNKPLPFSARDELAGMTPSALRIMHEDIEAEHQANILKLAQHFDELGAVIDGLKGAEGWKVEVTLRSPDGKTKKTFARDDCSGSTGESWAAVRTLATEAVAFINANAPDVKQVQWQRSEVKKKIQAAQEAFAKRRWEIGYALEKAEAAEKVAKAKAADVKKAKASMQPVAKTMSERLVRSGDLAASR
jgi:hypothetical protein